MSNEAYWSKRYAEGNTGWDIGEPSTPLKTYFDQVSNKSLRIVIPGAGNAYEAEYLHKQGFTNVHVVDLAEEPLNRLRKACPAFNEAHLHHQDFFLHEGVYDIIVEQTFFCAIEPALRDAYVQHAKKILAPKGKIIGLLFTTPIVPNKRPFGGTKEEYIKRFSPHFELVVIENCYNSIAPRKGNELFIHFRKK